MNQIRSALGVASFLTISSHVGGFGAAPAILAIAPEAEMAGFKPAQCLLQCLLERAADRHRLADRLHLRR